MRYPRRKKKRLKKLLTRVPVKIYSVPVKIYSDDWPQIINLNSVELIRRWYIEELLFYGVLQDYW